MKNYLLLAIIISSYSINAFDYHNRYRSNNQMPTNISRQDRIYTDRYYSNPMLGIANQDQINQPAAQQRDPYATPKYPYSDADIIE